MIPIILVPLKLYKKDDYESELLTAQQKTLLWFEEKYLAIAPAKIKNR